ncbi:caspase family protein [Labrys sp. LIt4]|uniref:caspase family protein n=1 Tax=Labrys sp. LIt4 TaxID=2821355 RepID=UPI001ADEE186|nr:caspase family protein [Labrys sp. LIt4]MBP0580847.1 caspase family protein [Labrys sp. LIt4]
MRARCVLLLFVLLAFGSGMTPASAKLLALIVGNNTYQEVPPLQTAVNDAQAMREALQRAGFAVTLVENGTKRQISRAMATVEGAISPGDTVLFHYSGHGVEIDGQNWLLPVDIPTAKEGEAGLIKDESFNAADIIDRFRARGARQVVAILDACRNNPFAQGGTRALPATRGLARMEADGGVFIMFSAGTKQEALDRLSAADPEKTSVFVRSFLPLLGRQDLTLIDMAKETQEKVRTLARSAGREQVPAYYDGIVGRVTLTGELPSARSSTSSPAITPDPPSAGNGQSENLFWQSIQNSSDPAMFQAYLDQVGAGTFTGTYKVLAQIKLAALQPKAAQQPATKPIPSPPPAAGQATASPPPMPGNAPLDAAVTACDQAAADTRDPDKPAAVTGVRLSADSASAAIAACSKAIAVPGAPRRVYYQLSAAYGQNGQDALALAQLQKAASLGHGLSLYELAGRYLAGRGVPKDAIKALSLYYKAIDGNYGPAISRIAWMYANGLGASRDYRKAVAIYELGVKNKEPTAYSGLGLLYLKGQGVAKDVGKACDLFRQGASAGDADAAGNLNAKCPPG